MLKKYFYQSFIGALTSFLLLIAFMPAASFAEDIEVYYQNKKPKVNLMFVLDSSYSMDRCQGGKLICGSTPTRMDILKNAMQHVIENLKELKDQDISVGVASLTGSNSNILEEKDHLTVGGGSYNNIGASGGYVLYPMRGVNESLGEDSKVTGETVVSTSDYYIASEGFDGNSTWKTGKVSDFQIPYNGSNDNGLKELTALTFKSVDIPHGAKIKSAILELDRKSTASRQAKTLPLYFYYSIESNAKEFNTEQNNRIKNKVWSGADPFAGENGFAITGSRKGTSAISNNPHKLDLQEFVENIVGGSQWCGGSDLTLGVRLQHRNHDLLESSNRNWVITTQAGAATKNPTLRIEWELDLNDENIASQSGCSNIARKVTTSENNRIADSSGLKDIEENKAFLKNAKDQISILSFSPISLDKEDTINSVVLRLPIVNQGRSDKEKDKIENYEFRDFSVDVKTKMPSFTNYDQTATSLWASEEDKTTITSSLAKDGGHNKRGHFRWLDLDLTDWVVNKYCEDSDNKKYCSISSFDVLLKNWNEEYSDLNINYLLPNTTVEEVNLDNQRPFPEIKFNITSNNSALFADTHGEKIIQVVNGLSTTLFSAEKPVHKAYLETARYMLGGNVYFGNGKHDLNGCGAIRQRALSHPMSYVEGGLAEKKKDCLGLWSRKNNLETPYDSPIGLQTCEKNAIIMVTDGRFKTTAGDKMPELLSQEPFVLIDKNADKNNDFSCGTDGFFKTLGDIFTPLNNFGSSLKERAPYQCSALLASHLKNKDENQKERDITTHMIGFMLDADENRQENSSYAERTAEAMRSVTNAGGGVTRLANSPEELTTAMMGIVHSVVFDNASMASPGIAVDESTRLEHLNDLFYGLFKPVATPAWLGNLKKYQIGPGENNQSVIDANSKEAIDTTTGLFKPTAASFWNETTNDDGQTGFVVDGNDVEIGGSALHLQRRLAEGAQRNLFITANSQQDGNKIILLDNSVKESLANEELGINTEDLTDDEQNEKKERIFEWLSESWGDFLHSEPRVVGYGNQQNNDNVIYASSNNGVLHAVKASDGKELFVFSPKEELAKASKRLDSVENFDPLIGNFAASGDEIVSLDSLRDEKDFSYYGLDGSWTFWRDAKDNGELNHVYGYAGQRRGGRNYYALDLTSPGLKNDPDIKLLWQITPGEGSDGFDLLGQTWSDPQLGKIRYDGSDVPVLVFAGGYERKYDKGVSGTEPDKGNAIFIVNAETGKLIWHASADESDSSESLEYTSHKALKYSIPATPAVVDINGDGYFDYIYVGDLQGQVFRADVNNAYNSTAGTTGGDKLVERVNLLADVSSDGSKGSRSSESQGRFYSTPAVAIGNDGESSVVTVVLGSGNRSNPLQRTSGEKVYGFFDRWAINRAEVPHPVGIDVSEDGETVESVKLENAFEGNVDGSNFTVNTIGKGGWMLPLDDSTGVWEKALSEAVVADNTVFFTTFTTEENALSDACNRVVGKGRLYAVDLTSGGIPEKGVPGAESKSDKYVELPTVGIPPKPQILLNTLEASDTGLANACNRTLTGVVGTSTFDINAGNLCGLQRTGWFETSEEKAKKLLGEDEND